MARRARRALAAALLLAAAPGCISATSSYAPLPVAHGALPGRGRARVEARGTGLTGIDPSEAPAPSSQWVPDGQLELSLAIRAERFFGVRLHTSLAAPEWARPAGSRALQRPTRVVGTVGIGAGVRISIDAERSVVDLTLDSSYAFAPAYHVRTGSTVAEETIETQVILEGGAYFSHFALPWLRLVGGLALRNHPALASAFAPGSDPAFRWGDALAIAVVGAELHVTEWLAIAPTIEWPFAGPRFTYFPTLGLGIGLTIERGPGMDPLSPPPPRSGGRALDRPFP